jgi:Uma2 family endonuclease
MAIAEAQKIWTLAEYLDHESREGEKYEFRNDNIILMAGGSLDHNRIART